MRRFFIISGAVFILFLVLGCGEDIKAPPRYLMNFQLLQFVIPVKGRDFPRMQR
jgi:hypothetical protein